MKPLLFILFTGSVLLFSCKQKSSSTGDKEKETIVNSFAGDSSEIRDLVIGFYTWYSKNYDRFNQYDLYSGTRKKDTPPYKINWDVVEKYQAFIHDSVPQLGATFLKNQKILFQKCDSAFKVDVQDEVPYFFDFDWYTNTQEDPSFLLEEMKKSKQWLLQIKGDDATLEIRGFDEGGTKPSATVINLLLSKENGHWKIAKTWSE